MALRKTPPSHLKRLNPHYYQGRAWVHWTMTIDKRDRGWLCESMHHSVRELLLHTCSRYRLLCPAYCLMPDHGHFLWMGTSPHSDQLNALKFFRRSWNEKLEGHGVKLQNQAYDHVLLESERNHEAFEDTVLYILKNPQRANLSEDYSEWPNSGAIAPGYPELPFDPVDEFWEKFWKIHNRLVTEEEKTYAAKRAKTSR